MPDYTPAWYHYLIAERVREMTDGSLRRLIVSMPPRHGKSELISRRLPALLLGRDPDTQIIAASYSGGLASRNNRDVQRVMDSPQYHRLYPNTKLADGTGPAAGSWLRNGGAFEVVGYRGRYQSTGVGGGITGMGAKWLLLDDPIKNREEADSSTYRASTWDWYTSTFSTRQEQDARILVVMTRWHSDDIVGRLLELGRNDPQADQWSVLQLPAISKEDGPDYDQRRPGEALWPDRYPIQDLERMRASIGEYQWSALYQQEPRSGGGTEWPDEYFPKSMWFDEWPKTVNLKTIAVDPSKGRDGKHGDYSAIVMLGRDVDGTLYCEADLARRNTETIVDMTLEHQHVFRADVIAVEANQFQELMVAQVVEKSRARGFTAPVLPIINNVGKPVRIRRLGPYLAQHSIRFKANSAGTRLLVAQLRDFPTADHDDGPDALEMALRCMIDIHNGRARAPARRLIT